MTEISFLPVEMLERIFMFLDGRSLSRAQCVSVSWRVIVLKMQRTKSFWKKICCEEIAESIVEELLGFKNIPKDIHQEGDMNDNNSQAQLIDWKSVYKAWFRGGMISKWPNWTKRVLAYDDNPITCTKLSGSWVFTGHRNGSLCSWNLYTGEMSLVYSQHLNMVTDFALVDILHLGNYGSIEYPFHHHHVISVSKDHHIQVNYLLASEEDIDQEREIIFHHSDSLETVRVFGSIFAVNSVDNTITLWKMEFIKEPNYHLKILPFRHLIGPAEILRSLGFWHNQVQCLCANGKMKIYSLQSNEWNTLQQYIMPCIHDGVVKNCNVGPVTDPFLFRNRIMFLPTARGKMLVSVDGEHFSQYHVMKSIRTTAITIALHGSVLAIGTENGKLLLYHVPNLDDLMRLNLSEPSWEKVLSEASIIAVDIQDNGESPVVAACTTESMFIITWYAKSSHKTIRNRDINSVFSVESS